MKSQNQAIRPERYFAAGQTVLGLCLLACTIALPHYFFNFDQGGVSNYGTEAATKWLFVAGFGAATLGTLLAALTLPRTTTRRPQLRLSLYVLTALYLLVMLSTFTYKLNESLRQVHEYAALGLFAGATVVSVWLRFIAVRDVATKRAFSVFCVFFGVGVLNFLGVINLLFSVQIGAGIAFAYMTAHGIKILSRKSKL